MFGLYKSCCHALSGYAAVAALCLTPLMAFAKSSLVPFKDYFNLTGPEKIELYGFRNGAGDVMIPAKYERVWNFADNGLARVKHQGRYCFIDTTGTELKWLQDATDFNRYGLAIIKSNNKYGIVNGDFKLVLLDIFDRIEEFQPNGMAMVKYEGKYGYVDTLGNVVVPVIYDKVEPFQGNGMVIVKSGNKMGAVDIRGRVRVKVEMSDLKPFSANGLAAAKFEGQWGFVSEKGDWVYEPQYKSAKPFDDKGYAEVSGPKGKERLHFDPSVMDQMSAQDDAKAEEERIARAKAKVEEERLALVRAQKEEEERFAKVKAKAESFATLQQFIEAGIGNWDNYLVAHGVVLPTEAEVKETIEKEISEWQLKGEFEPTAKWKERVNEETRVAKINEIGNRIIGGYTDVVESLRNDYQQAYEALVDEYCRNYADLFAAQPLTLQPYDADNETFLISTADFGDLLLPVPLEEAPDFKKDWETWKRAAIAVFVPSDDNVALQKVSFGKYVYDSNTEAAYAQVEIDYNFRPVSLESLDYASNSAHLAMMDKEPALKNDINNSAVNKGVKTTTVKMSAGDSVDIDLNIPESKSINSNTFAVVIANSDYAHASKVAHAENDGKVLTEYLHKTLGLPETNVSTLINATYGQMASAMTFLEDVADAYRSTGFNVLFYYVGHGLPDDEGKKSYILPVDIDPRHVSICMPLDKLYADLGNLGANSVTVMIDACFSGTNRGDGMLVPQSMGVALKPKKAAPVGNMVVFAAAEGNETAFPYEEKKHGLFTYWLLKKIQESAGQVTLGELGDYVIDNVKKTSITVNRKPQTPVVAISPLLSDSWRSMTLINN